MGEWGVYFVAVTLRFVVGFVCAGAFGLWVGMRLWSYGMAPKWTMVALTLAAGMAFGIGCVLTVPRHLRPWLKE